MKWIQYYLGGYEKHQETYISTISTGDNEILGNHKIPKGCTSNCYTQGQYRAYIHYNENQPINAKTNILSMELFHGKHGHGVHRSVFDKDDKHTKQTIFKYINRVILELHI